jgi:SnoaL-like domain
MEPITSLVERYVALWSEVDPQQRRRSIEQLWAEDGVHFSRSIEARGHAQIEARVAKAHAEFVGSGRYLFVSANNVESHHGGVRFNWQMVGATDQRVAAIGFDFLLLDADGRIRSDHQFSDPLP